MEESVDYGSDTSLAGDARTVSDTPMSEVHPPTPLGPFADPDEVIVTNPLDGQHELAVQREESARRHVQMVTTLRNQRDYVFTPPSVEERLRQTTDQSLATWTIGPVADSPEEGASGQALRERRNNGRRRRRLRSLGAPHSSPQQYLKARGQLRNRTRYASATTVAASAGQTVTNNPPIDTTSGGKRPRSRNDTGHDIQKHPRRMGSLAEGESHIPMSSPTFGYPRHFITYWYWPWRRPSVGVGVPKEEHEKVLLEMNGLRETLGKTQSALNATRARVQELESGHTRMEAQLDLLIRMQQPVARPTSAAQAPPSSRKTDPDTA
uniref:Uncharacterized protein n=1 Tax=Hyaloperonospora arabidopsidis (strain Emoy2) TaxID=559515 RepID=M4B6L5_HYAAE